MACANPHSLVEAESDDTFKEALHQADILLPDGAGIVLAAKILNLDVKERVAGTEFFIELTQLCDDKGQVNVFF
jgi:N-acetylglucosaminyldiphosphoundecaprenol N-acetyl-beta-D-mannosaminyltransferase